MRTTYLKIITAALFFVACLRFGQSLSTRGPKGGSCKDKVCESCGGVHAKEHCASIRE